MNNSPKRDGLRPAQFYLFIKQFPRYEQNKHNLINSLRLFQMYNFIRIFYVDF